jgi:hypothetical protein
MTHCLCDHTSKRYLVNEEFECDENLEGRVSQSLSVLGTRHCLAVVSTFVCFTVQRISYYSIHARYHT